MGIFKKDLPVNPTFGNKALSYIYYGTKLVWQAIRSCFGKGFWINDKPWSNDDAWKN